MKFWPLLGILIIACSANGAELKQAITSVELSPGLNYSSVGLQQFSSIEAAQKFATARGLNEINLRINFRLKDSQCKQSLPALSLGYIYDQDRAIFNGQLIGSTGNPELSKRRLSLIPRVYPIPSQILHCPGENRLDLSLRRILGGWIGPFAGSIELGELHELQQKAMVTEAWGPLFQRDIGILLLAISILLISLFYRYPDNHRQSAFVAFSFSVALLCLSLSGWYYRYFDFPNIIFRLHFAIVSLALITQVLFVAAYRGMTWAKVVSRRLFFSCSFTIFLVISFSVNSVSVLLNIYLIQLLALILASWAVYLLPLIRLNKVWRDRNFSPWVEASLFLLHAGASMDIARIWKLHNMENVSPYTYGISIFIIGSILASELVQVFQKAAQTAKAELQLNQSKRQTEFARQIGHDIRSPLAALNMMVTLLKDVPEDRRLVIRNATQRINDIANNLLDRSWLNTSEVTSEVALATPESVSEVLMLSSVIDSIVSEKRVQYRDRNDVDIEADLNESYGLFSKINPVDFARALSNLIDNSVKAFEISSGRIEVVVDSDASFNRIVVSDNGRGIATEVLGRLGSAGASFGKDAGSGLGLYQAKLAVEAAGGKLSIKSEIGKGTSVTIALPQSEAPAWFIGQLAIPEGFPLISVDDDQTVHQIWDNRLQSVNGKRPKHIAFTSIAQFEEWHSANPALPSKILVDFEFLGHSENGLQMIERLKIAKKAILVSSRAEDPHIQARAITLGLKVLPKALAPLVPIEVFRL